MGAYIILNTIGGQSLTKLTLPGLSRLVKVDEAGQYINGVFVAYTPTPGVVIGPPGEEGMRLCDASRGECQNSPSVNKILNCLHTNRVSTAGFATYQGKHNINSCHFGGRTCTDGSHAIDEGFNDPAVRSLGWQRVKSQTESCGQSEAVQVYCRCENNGGSKILPCNDPEATHMHCNIDNARCTCN